MKQSEENYFWLAFSNCPGIGPNKFGKLLDYFGSAKNAWVAPQQELIASGIGPMTAETAFKFTKTFSITDYLRRLEKAEVSFITQSDSFYPPLLRESKNPPFVLYVKGNKELLMAEKLTVAVAGTRKITDYGRMVTELLVKDLVAAKCVIVSGLAMGVDAVSHQVTLDAKGQTIAVLGSGVDYCTPRENQYIYDRIIAAGGAIISENPLGFRPNKGSFPMRNRIIAGMSAGVLVTEGAEDSGSLITAKDAFAAKRHVFAVPGPITSQVSKGPIALFGQGAKAVTSAQDILGVLGVKNYKSAKQKNIKGDSPDEQLVIDLLAHEQETFDDIVKKTGLTSAKVGMLLTMLEMKNLIKSQDSGAFTLVY